MIQGEVIKGDQRGKKMGFPTLNLSITQKTKKLQEGVFVCSILFLGDAKRYVGILHIGPRPTFGKTKQVVEIHLLNFDRDVYGQKVRVKILQKIRKVRKFADEKILIRQIQKDVVFTKDFLKNTIAISE